MFLGVGLRRSQMHGGLALGRTGDSLLEALAIVSME